IGVILHTHCVLSSFLYQESSHCVLYTLSLHDALPISLRPASRNRVENFGISILRQWARGSTTHLSRQRGTTRQVAHEEAFSRGTDRKSTRLNSSHVSISYAVFCLKKKKKNTEQKRAEA